MTSGRPRSDLPKTGFVSGRFSHRGFTLIELMIVVAIIGILVAIGVPNLLRFQAKARQSEAKSNLKAYFTSSKTYFAENGTHVCGTCQWTPEKGNSYTYGLDQATGLFVLGSMDCPGWAGNEGQTPSAFTASADGNIDSDEYCDFWHIDDANTLTNTQNDVSGG